MIVDGVRWTLYCTMSFREYFFSKSIKTTVMSSLEL